MVDVPITTCTAQLQARSALRFISLIKSLNLAGFHEYFATHHQHTNLKPKSFTRLFTARTASRAGAGPAGEQAADHDDGESGEADPQKLNPPASRPHPRQGVKARLLQSSSEYTCQWFSVIWFNAWAAAWIAGKQTGWAGQAHNKIRHSKYVLRQSKYVHGCNIKKGEKSCTRLRKKF